MLLLLTLAFLGLAALGSAVPVLPSVPASLCALCLLAGLLGLGRGGAPASLPLPFGFPGVPAVFVVDRVSFAFLPAAALAGAAATVTIPAAETWRLSALMAATLLVLCAGDACLLVIGTGLVLLASGRPARAVIASFTLAGSLAGMLPHAGLLPQDQWPALRTEAVAVSSWAAPILLVLAPVLILTGLAGVGISGMLPPVVASFLLVRVLFDLSGPSTPFASGLIVAGAGLTGAVERGLRAVRAGSLETVLAGLSGLGGFVALAGLGVGLAARAADLPAIASASLAGSLLLVLLLACAVPLASIAVASVVEQAGSRRLGALGGLAQPMPLTLSALSAALATIAGLPPLAGFAPVWLVAQSLLSAQRFGGLATPIILALALASLGLAIGLGLVASFRLLAIVFGGRPRTPRGAAASEARPAMLRAMGALGGLLLAASVLPGPLLRFFDPTVASLTGVSLAARAGPLALQAVAGGTVWSPLAAIMLVGAPVALIVWLGRRTRLRAVSEAPAWDGGAGPPPEWLPFGEPRAQASAPGLAHQILSALGLATARLPGEGVGLRADRSSGEASRTSLAVSLHASRRAARHLVRLNASLSNAAPVLLAILVATLLAISVLAIGGGLA